MAKTRNAASLVGKKFNKLTVLERIENIYPGHASWLCLCDCGNKTKATTGSLQSNHIKSCGCAHKDEGERRLRDLVGEKFGSLLVLKRVENISDKTAWSCLCDCGKELEVLSCNLVRGNSKNCGCFRPEVSRENLKIANAAVQERVKISGKKYTPKACSIILYEDYKRNAENRGRSFNLSLESFREITSRDCHYCGAPPSQKTRSSKYGTPYIYNGIDRKDNSTGYEDGNCFSCCKPCNYAKGTMSYKDFLLWLDRVAQFQKRTEIEVI